MNKKSKNIKRVLVIIFAMMLLVCSTTVSWAEEIDAKSNLQDMGDVEELNGSIETYGVVGETSVTVPSHQTRVVYLGDKNDIQISSTVMITTSSKESSGGVNVSIYNGVGQFKKSYTLGAKDSLKKSVPFLGTGPYRFEITNLSSSADVYVSVAIH